MTLLTGFLADRLANAATQPAQYSSSSSSSSSSSRQQQQQQQQHGGGGGKGDQGGIKQYYSPLAGSGGGGGGGGGGWRLEAAEQQQQQQQQAEAEAEALLRLGRLLQVRKLLNTTGLVGGALCWVAVPHATSPAGALFWLSLALSCHALSIGGYEANKLDIAGPEAVGLLQSLINTFANTAGLTAVPLAAYLADGGHGGGGEGEGEQQEHHHGGWAMVFYLVALAYLVPALLFFKLATTRQLFA
eukprot:COSAG05_NODE_2264_length_3316_cov_12.087659_2_plen_244_part_00